ncbi:MAG: hypothetical protein V9H26_19825 [Verrucomicrobiota bacterium]
MVNVVPMLLEQTAGVVEHRVGRVDRAFRASVSVWPSSVLRQVADERLDRGQQDGFRIAEQAFVVFELVELIVERSNLLHLVVDHLDELRDFLRRC